MATSNVVFTKFSQRVHCIEDVGVPADRVQAISKHDLLPFFEQKLGIDAWETRQLLWDTYEPYCIWLVFTLIGLASMVAITVYDRVVRAADANPEHSLNKRGATWVRFFLMPITAILLLATVLAPSIGLGLNTTFFAVMLVISFVPSGTKEPTAP